MLAHCIALPVTLLLMLPLLYPWLRLASQASHISAVFFPCEEENGRVFLRAREKYGWLVSARLRQSVIILLFPSYRLASSLAKPPVRNAAELAISTPLHSHTRTGEAVGVRRSKPQKWDYA